MKVVQQDPDPKSARELIEFLAPHETEALFLLGNLESRFEPAFIYRAYEHHRLAGVCGYYPTFRSCSIYSKSAAVSRSLGQKVLEAHPAVNALLGMARIVLPAYEEFISRGRRPLNDPIMDFLELSMENFRPFFLPDVRIRPVTDRDIDSVAQLQRLIHQGSMDDPVTEEERMKVRASIVSFCIEVDGKIVSVATSNGLAIHAFQILGVVTLPAYRRRGYAKALCSHLIEFMQKRGATQSIIFTGKDNSAARNCYQDLGFQITDEYLMGLFHAVSVKP